ncbi:FUSC family protein [Streptomyces sp. NPDC059985]|uniref:FUSC family protein n=1 Tax=Streptomyces sp. NPDC059985 TaxID=3347025 RepID=UPI0036BBCCC8
MKHTGGGIRAAPLFRPTPGSRPAVIHGLFNGLAVGMPLLIGIAAGNPGGGALASLGAYVAAFTNKGGPCWDRTRGLLVAAAANAAAFYVGELTADLFPAVLILLAVLVFLPAMGTAVHSVFARLGTMPATALLAGAGTENSGVSPSTAQAALLVLAGGIGYATITAFTPSPRARTILTVIAEPYRATGTDLLALAEGQPTETSRAAAALTRAQDAVQAVRGPGGDDRLADLFGPLVSRAAEITDLVNALTAAGKPPAPVSTQYAAAARHTSHRIARLADHLTHPSQPDPGMQEGSQDPLVALEDACHRMRVQAATGHQPYEEVAQAGRQRRLLIRLADATDAAHLQTGPPASARSTPVPARPSQTSSLDLTRLREALTLSSATYRHALRVTAVTTAVFALVWATDLPHGEWAALAVLRVLRPQYASTFERARQRVTGNIIGGTCAAVFIAVLQQPTAIALALFLIISIGFTLRPINYAFWVVFGTPLVLLLGDVNHPGDWSDALIRIVMTLLGTAAALAGIYLLWPTWEHQRLADKADRAVRETSNYLDAALQALNHPDADLTAHRRRAEHALDRAQDMATNAGREPGRDRSRVRLITRTLSGLRLLAAQTSALAVHRNHQADRIPGLDDFRAHAVQALVTPLPEERQEHMADLADSLDQMSDFLGGLHQQRRTELEAGRYGETPIRALIRANEPVIDLLAAVAASISTIRKRPLP